MGAQVSWQWFDVFWANPHLGRVFRPEEDQPNAESRSSRFLIAHGNAASAAIPASSGRSILLNQESYQVIGVTQPDFNWPNEAELWTPIALPSSQYF